jgi:biotin synthase
MVHHPQAYDDTLTVTKEILAKVDVPISGLVMATLLNGKRLRAFKDASIDIIGIGLDAASQEVFHQTRGRGAGGSHSWEQHWEIVHIARELYGPKKVNCHVVVGLGETDRELVELFYRCRAIEVEAYLFSFNPEPGTVMGGLSRTPISRWRRIQLIKNLIEDTNLPTEAFEFDDKGNLTHIDASNELIDLLISSGTPFMTGGCPDRNGKLACNRPYGSYKPGEEFRDFPFRATEDDIRQIRKEMRLDEILGVREPA